MTPVDLDGVATSPPLPEAAEAMMPWLGDHHANPSSIHGRGVVAARALEEARESVSLLVGASPEQVVFTSGATEANNHAVLGAARLARRLGRSTLGVPAHEHPSLLHPARSLARSGCDLRALAVGRDGLVQAGGLPLDKLGVLALSLAHAELGALQPVGEITRAARTHGTLVVVDATLAAGRVAVDMEDLGDPDLLTLSFHHFGGPMGVGAVVIRENLGVPPMLQGGIQEEGRRPGSPNLAGCIGAGVAAAIARRDLRSRSAKLASLGAVLRDGILASDGVRLTGPPPERRLPGHLSLTINGVEGESLVFGLEHRDVLAATGSPCAEHAGLPSAALRAAGYSSDEARGAVLLCVPPTASLSRSDARRAAREVVAEIVRLRAIGVPAEGTWPD
jgi:cysteine desulfurase